ncbi:MAG: diaminopimelate epimerase [Nitrospiraceae bacterium]|nr:diaminopimelate epimerase [Nitrospiraceae bacterium]
MSRERRSFPLPFAKMQGTGNDFVLLDGIKNNLDDLDLTATAKKLCDRRFGIGADQLLILLPSQKADFRMLIFNADGSQVQMCGNGIRCLAKYIWDGGLSGKETLEIETLAGIIKPMRKDGQVRVDMGVPQLEGRKIPVDLDGRVIDYPLKVEDAVFPVTCVSMGNPHAVIFIEGVDGFPLAHYGPLIENNPLFPERTNVEFVEVLGPREIKMRVWERGSGETLACGTGASASGVASALKGLTERSVKVRLRGGGLDIDWAGDGHLYMTGPAEEVFRGEILI